MAKKLGFIDRLMLGKEKSETYARASLPSNRWELFWDILKGRFGKLVIINLLMLLFFIPLIALLLFRYVTLSSYGSIYPFSQVFGVGYLSPPSLVGFSENIVFNVNLTVYLLLPIVLLIASVGISGGAYVIRNMVWTEGIFVSNDFWRGIKQNFKQICLVCLVYSVVFYITMLSASLAKQSYTMGIKSAWIFKFSEVFSYVILAFFSIMTFHMITMSVTYEMKFKHLFKNSLLFTIGLFPQSIFFLLLGTIPFLLLLLPSFIASIGIMVILLIGLSIFFLVWTDFSQWAFDKFINDKVDGAKKNKGIYEKVKESNSESLKKYREQIALTAHSTLNSRPIKPITDDDIKLAELPSSFSRNDIVKLNQSKQAMYDDHKKYVEEHLNDPEFVAVRQQEALNEKDREERDKRIEKAKRELAKRNRNK